MAPFRIPFTSKRPTTNGVEIPSDENVKPSLGSPYKPSLALSTKERRDEPNEFKLSSVADDGQYLPPSPTGDKPSFWHKSPATTTRTNSSTARSALAEHEPFSISRESFDSYRRSFDISGRSPIIHADSFTSRTSLDSRRSGLPPRSSLSNDTFSRLPSAQKVDDFEDVKLQDETIPNKPKKKSFLSRFGETAEESEDGKHHFSILPGRRRGQSGKGSELGNVPRPDSSHNKAKPESTPTAA